MVSEKICLRIIGMMFGQKMVLKPFLKLIGSEFGNTEEDFTYEHSLPYQAIYRKLLHAYPMDRIESAIRWLQYSAYVLEIQPYQNKLELDILMLTELGKGVAQLGKFSEEEKTLLYQDEDPYAVFIAQQFNRDDQDLVDHVRDEILKPIGLKLVDGRADGLEMFRDAILAKIKKCRFFLCLLTKRVELTSGDFTSSTWLYQETGAAIAYGKKPLLLVEEGINSHFVGEFQKVYEHEMFTRSNHPRVFKTIQRRFIHDLEVNHIPLPSTS